MKTIDTLPAASFGELIDYAVVDRANESVGTLHSLWSDQSSGALEFLGVKTGWLFGSNHVVPTAQAQVDDASRTIQVPYDLALIKEAPAIAADAEISEEEEAEIYRYYGVGGGVGSDVAGTRTTETRRTATTASAATAATAATTGLTTGAAATSAATSATGREAAARSAGETIEVPLSEEQLKVGKRTVDAGAVRLRKIVRTEVVNTPVELRREDVVIERIPASEVRAGDIPAADFNEKNIDITLHREEAVVAKETVVTGAVRARKTAETETRTVSDTVRKEDVEVLRDGKTEVTRDDSNPRR